MLNSVVSEFLRKLSHESRILRLIFGFHEEEKKRTYNSRIIGIEQGTFAPIILTIKGVMSPEATQFLKSHTQKITEKTGERYDNVTRLMGVKIRHFWYYVHPFCVQEVQELFATPREGDAKICFNTK